MAEISRCDYCEQRSPSWVYPADPQDWMICDACHPLFGQGVRPRRAYDRYVEAHGGEVTSGGDSDLYPAAEKRYHEIQQSRDAPPRRM
jgi:hypothetical protein